MVFIKTIQNTGYDYLKSLHVKGIPHRLAFILPADNLSCSFTKSTPVRRECKFQKKFHRQFNYSTTADRPMNSGKMNCLRIPHDDPKHFSAKFFSISRRNHNWKLDAITGKKNDIEFPATGERGGGGDCNGTVHTTPGGRKFADGSKGIEEGITLTSVQFYLYNRQNWIMAPGYPRGRTSSNA